MPRIGIVAGEASGDLLGAGLIRAARGRCPDMLFEGIAGPAMREAGCEPWYRTEDLSVMGLFEVLRHLPRLARISNGVTQRFLRDPPAAYVGIDAPDFNLRVAGRLRRRGIPTVQYVCPSVWAWRAGRIRTLQRACDEVLCLLPFEEPLLRNAGVPCRFVGHPFADEIPAAPAPASAREELGLTAPTVIAILPGSRLSEIQRLGGIFAATASRLRAALGNVTFVAPMVNPLVAAAFSAQIRAHAAGCDVRLIDGRARVALAASDVALVASGTATLEAMLLGRPMVVAYRLAAATYAVGRAFRLVRSRYFSLPNLLADAPLVPEFLQAEVRPEVLAEAILAYLRSPELVRELQQELRRQGDRLRRGASDGAARAVLERAGLP